MERFTVRARTQRECIEKIRDLYGKDYEIKETIIERGFLGLGIKEVEMIGVYGTDLETKKRQILAAANNSLTDAGRIPNSKPSLQVLPDSIKQQPLSKAMPEASVQAILNELSSLGGAVRDLQNKVAIKPSSPSAIAPSDHPSLHRLEEDLLFNEFTPSFVKPIMERVRHEFTLEELDEYEEIQKKALLWIGEKILIYQEPDPNVQVKKKPRVIVLVGPTGVGKTTTLVKLAALYGEYEQGAWQKQVRLVSLDSYRIGAEYQIQTYGDIMNIPVEKVENQDGLKKVLSLYKQDVDFILLDTIGMSPLNYVELGKMKEILEACPAKTETHLCIAASFKPGDIKEFLKLYEQFKYKSVIITKLDETSKIGNVLSILAEERKSVSFITTGQVVPWDIERASVIRFLMNLKSFTIDKGALADHFSRS